MPALSKNSYVREQRGADASGAQAFLSDPPMLLIVGSLDAGSRADVLAYARGLAESQVIAKDACFVDAIKLDGRWLYEVHEGGVGRSVVRWVANMLSNNPGSKVNLPLAGERVASIGEVGGELVTIVYPPSEEKYRSALSGSLEMEPGAQLAPFYGSAAPLRNAAAGLFAVSVLLFLISGTALFLRANAMDVERFAGRFAASNQGMRTDLTNLPSVQLDIAAKKIKANSGYLSYLKLEKGRWSSAQSTSGIAKPESLVVTNE